MVYLDHNATTPVDGRVVEAMLPYLTEIYGNPSSVHRAGRLARAAIDRAREQVAALVNATPGQIHFTSGGTEANNLALFGVAEAYAATRIAVSTVEHASVLEPAQKLAQTGTTVDWLGVDRDGRLRDDPLALGADTALVSLMWANNETGTLQPVPKMADRARAAGVLMHTDAVQALGKVEVDFAASGVHLMTLSSHKINGPKGVGALIVDPAVDLTPRLLGGGQERGLRPGTENLPGIVGFGAAAEFAAVDREARAEHSRALIAALEAGLRELSGVTLFATGAERLPNTLMFALAGFSGEALLLGLDRVGVAISSGSACHSGSGEPSHVLKAMGVADELAHGTVRVSVGHGNGAADIDTLLGALRRLASSRLPLTGAVPA